MTREEAIETLKANYPDACFEQLRDAIDAAIYALKQPEIIRCRDCSKHHLDTLLSELWCDGRKVNPNHYCGYAERRGK